MSYILTMLLILKWLLMKLWRANSFYKRVRDADGKASNIERIELFVFSGSVVSQKSFLLLGKEKLQVH